MNGPTLDERVDMELAWDAVCRGLSGAEALEYVESMQGSTRAAYIRAHLALGDLADASWIGRLSRWLGGKLRRWNRDEWRH